MSFPRYPKYKPSGVEWLGEVPEGWEVKRSDNFLSYSRAQLDPKDFRGMEVFHYSIPVVQETGTGQLEDGSEIASGKQVVSKKAVLVSKLNPRKGTICIAEPQQALTLCSTEFVALEPNGCDIGYLSYLVRTEAFRQGLESKVTSVTNSHQRANPVDIYRFWNAWPPLAEQTAIAAFLDRETGKIDELVAEQRRLMELLKEKRQAVISHAVTRGLNPHAPLKPSGIEWLGEVPAGWEVLKLGHISIFKGGAGFPDSYQGQAGNEIPFFKVGDMTNAEHSGVMRKANHTVTEATAKELRAFVFPAGTIVFAKVGAALLLKRYRLLGQRSCIDNNMMGMSVGAAATTEFLLYVLPLLDLDLIVNPGAVPSMNEGQISGQKIALPPIEEQHRIVASLDTELAKFDTLTAAAQRAIDLLQERRTALISAAVTGQIDVRLRRP